MNKNCNNCFILYVSEQNLEGMESQAEEEQLPQIVDELHDTFVTVGAPIITLQIKVKGMNNYHKIITLEIFNVFGIRIHIYMGISQLMKINL